MSISRRRKDLVGSERGGVLTNQLRDAPCSVVLLDEIERASPNLLNLFLQAFDEGWLTDGVREIAQKCLRQVEARASSSA